MKIVIQFSRTKREIDGSFEVCGSQADLENLALQILNRVKSQDDPFYYGWVPVYANRPAPVANTPPVKWDDEA